MTGGCNCGALQNGKCDARCNIANCGWDMGDCCEAFFSGDIEMKFSLFRHFSPTAAVAAVSAQTAAPKPLLTALVDSSAARYRYIGGTNLLLGGVLVTQTRREPIDCLRGLAPECMSDDPAVAHLSEAPYGTDAVCCSNG